MTSKFTCIFLSKIHVNIKVKIRELPFAYTLTNTATELVFSYLTIHVNFEVQLLPHFIQHISKSKKDKSIPSFHIKHISKDYQAILGFIIFSLNKILKMSITQF